MMRKNMYNELVRAKQLSDSALSEAQHDLQVLNSRIKELEAELRVGFTLNKSQSANCPYNDQFFGPIFQRRQEEVTRLHSLAAQLDAEKDTIQASLDDRTEDVVALKGDLSKASKLLEEKTVDQ